MSGPVHNKPDGGKSLWRRLARQLITPERLVQSLHRRVETIKVSQIEEATGRRNGRSAKDCQCQLAGNSGMLSLGYDLKHCLSNGLQGICRLTVMSRIV